MRFDLAQVAIGIPLFPALPENEVSTTMLGQFTPLLAPLN